ncbi:Golgi transport complex subunit 5-domain-containing protein [Lanmaoa asiatica]|nr:Golgi transport complex subunit 5-domain-containing protein [Lanmaoa asiatica]
MADYAVFAIADFDASAYASAVLAGEPYPPTSSSQTKPKTSLSIQEPAKEDISVAISKLDLGIEDVSKQIKTLVTAHHEDLLQHASNASKLSGSLSSIRRGLDEVESSFEKLRQKIRVPYQALQANVTRLQRIQQANDALRRTVRFAVLAKRLEAQMSELGGYESTSSGKRAGIGVNGPAGDHQEDKERMIAKAALSIAELIGALLDGPDEDNPEEAHAHPDGESSLLTSANSIPLRSVNAAAAYIPFITDSRKKVKEEMEAMVLQGLTSLDQSLLASSLQTAYNLRMLPTLVKGLVRDLSEAVEERIQNAFDLARISKEIVAKGGLVPAELSFISKYCMVAEPPQASQGLLYKSRVRTEPTNITAPQFAAALWARLESLVEEMAGCCTKVYTLEKVLNLKKDPLSGVSFLDEALEAIDSKPSTVFWSSLGKSLEKCVRDAAKGSSFLHQTLSSGYPKLLRLFHEFFASIAVHTDTVYTLSYQSPETILVLRALSTFEALYVSRSSTRMNEAVAQAFSGGSRAPPGANEGANIVRTVTNELDSARSDPLLVRTVAKNAATSLESVVTRADGLVVSDRSAVSLLGPMATPQQLLNGHVATCLYHCWTKLEKLTEEHTESVATAIGPSITKIRGRYDQIVDPLLIAIKKELAGILLRLHRLDLKKAIDPTSGISGTSLYMKDLVDKLNFVKTGLLSNFAAEIVRPWVLGIVKYVIRIFVLHASIAKPLGESGKLQLTTDMAELEFSLNAFLADGSQSKRGGNLESIGDEYKALRAMRPLLFFENAVLASPERTAGLAPLVVLHHILVRSPLPLPHILHGWQESEYVRWVDEHSPEEALSLIDGSITHWEKRDRNRENAETAVEYINLARAVLRTAQRTS